MSYGFFASLKFIFLFVYVLYICEPVCRLAVANVKDDQKGSLSQQAAMGDCQGSGRGLTFVPLNQT